jgi:hypothetical protein
MPIETIVIHHFQIIVVKQWSYKAESPQSVLHHTSHDIQMEFMTNSGSGLGSIGFGKDMIIQPNVEVPQNLVQSK